MTCSNATWKFRRSAIAPFPLGVLLLLGACLPAAEPPGDEAARRRELERILRILPKSEPWEAWLEKSGELPSDFSRLPSVPGLPDPLSAVRDGRLVPVREPEKWPARRAELLSLIHRYILGSVPPPPGNVEGRVVARRDEEGCRAEEIELTFGPERKAKLSLELLIPRAALSGDAGRFPVFLTQHNHRAWALIALSRGYIGCVYAGSDDKDDTTGFIPVWPEHDWTKLARRAFAASRCIDYLSTLPFVDKDRIAMTGHSRNGKMSLMAAAMDERIAAVISSSSGAGGSMPARLFSEAHFGEGIEIITRVFPDWLHPRLRFFAGREDRLPVDFNELVALAAPRSCLIATAMNDPVESVWATQEVYLSAKRVYELLGHRERIAIAWRPGTHGTSAETIESYLDWIDAQFDRGKAAIAERLFYPSWERWLNLGVEPLDPAHFPPKGIGGLLLKDAGGLVRDAGEWRTKRGEISARIRSLLGDEPPAAAGRTGDYGVEERYRAVLLMRPGGSDGVSKRSINFGDYLAGDLYYPENATIDSKKLPGLVWLHPHSASNGYVAGYKLGIPTHLLLAQAGFVVLAFDQIGFGSRIPEVERFYERHTRWTLLGKMVRDALAAAEALRREPMVDAERVHVLGYAMGGIVALHAAALDERIAGAASVAGFTPLRLATAAKGSGIMERFGRWHMLIPQLGHFEGHEARVPYDFHEVLALIAPRKLLVVAPTLDREATLDDVQACLGEVEKVYTLLGAGGNLRKHFPEDYNRLSPKLQLEVIRRLQEMAGE